MQSGQERLLISALVALLMIGPSKMIYGQLDAIQFVDITVPAGISFKHVSSPEKKYIVESMSGGVALFDYDNDGYLDIFLVNSLTVELLKANKRTRSALYHNNGDGTFSDVSNKAGVADSIGYYGLDVVASDFDGDGRIDVFVANDSTPNYLYHNNGKGTFSEIGFESGLAVNGNGAEQGCMGVTVGDYDHDGRLDVFITNFDDEYNVLYRNVAQNSFTDVSYNAAVSQASLSYVVWGTKFFDYDNDGWIDLFVANGHAYPQRDHYRQRKLLHRNNHYGTFSEVGMQSGSALQEERASRGTAFGDIDNDG